MLSGYRVKSDLVKIIVFMCGLQKERELLAEPIISSFEWNKYRNWSIFKSTPVRGTASAPGEELVPYHAQQSLLLLSVRYWFLACTKEVFPGEDVNAVELACHPTGTGDSPTHVLNIVYGTFGTDTRGNKLSVIICVWLVVESMFNNYFVCNLGKGINYLEPW